MSAEDDLGTLPPTAPGGGDFGVALNNRTDTIDESGIGGPSRLKLTVRPPPPQYPYADTFFTFEVTGGWFLRGVMAYSSDFPIRRTLYVRSCVSGTKKVATGGRAEPRGCSINLTCISPLRQRLSTSVLPMNILYFGHSASKSFTLL